MRCCPCASVIVGTRRPLFPVEDDGDDGDDDSSNGVGLDPGNPPGPTVSAPSVTASGNIPVFSDLDPGCLFLDPGFICVDGTPVDGRAPRTASA